MKRDLAYPIHMSLGDEIRQRPLRERIRDVLYGVWIVGWFALGIVGVLLLGSLQ